MDPMNCNCGIGVELPVTGLKLTLDPSALNIPPVGGGDGISYSLEEQWTGKYWVDGKKIYQKTIDCGALPNTTTKKTPHGIENLDLVIQYAGMATTATGPSASQQVAITHSHALSKHCILSGIIGPDVTIVTWVDYSYYIKTSVTIQYTCTDR